jgi:hypothetical protein
MNHAPWRGDSSFAHWDFGHLVLFRVSDFDIRIYKSLEKLSGAFLGFLRGAKVLRFVDV